MPGGVVESAPLRMANLLAPVRALVAAGPVPTVRSYLRACGCYLLWVMGTLALGVGFPPLAAPVTLVLLLSLAIWGGVTWIFVVLFVVAVVTRKGEPN